MIVDCPHCALRHVILDRASGTVARCDCGQEFRLPGAGIEADAIKCGNCGGNPPAGANHCPYCDAHLTTVRCGRCLAQAIEGDRHCRACGHALGTPVHKLGPGPDHVLACPRCTNPMRAAMAGDALLDECTRCGGVWLDHDVFQDIVTRERDRELLNAALSALGQARVESDSPRPETESRFYLPCPRCEKVMDRRQFAKVSRVMIDICKPHGIWFDHDELLRIVRFVSGGGMEKAAQIVHEKRIAEMDRARRRRASAVSSGTGLSRPMSGHMTLDVIAGVLDALLD